MYIYIYIYIATHKKSPRVFWKKINFNQEHIDHYYLWLFAIFRVASKFHRHRTSVVYQRKTWPSDFKRHFGWPIFYHQRSFAETETNGSHTVQDPSCKLDALKLPNRFPFALSRQRFVWPRIVAREHNYLFAGQFLSPFLDCFIQTIELCTLQTHNGKFHSSPTKHSTKRCLSTVQSLKLTMIACVRLKAV